MDGEREVTFGNSGIWMTTDQLGPAGGGTRTRRLVTRRTGPARAGGRDRGLVRGATSATSGSAASAARSPISSRPCWPWPCSSCSGPRAARGLAGRGRPRRVLALLHPDDPGQLVRRRGHGGEPLLPEPAAAGASSCSRAGARSSWRSAGAVVSAVFLWPMWASPDPPLAAPRRPRDRPALPALPPELTMLNDLSVFTEPGARSSRTATPRATRTSTGPRTRRRTTSTSWTTAPTAARRSGGVEGFWLRGGQPGGGRRARARAREAGDACASWAARRGTTSACGIGLDEQRFQLAPGPGGRGDLHARARLPVLRHLRPRAADAVAARRTGPAVTAGEEPRTLGSFVSIVLDVNRAAVPSPPGALARRKRLTSRPGRYQYTRRKT